MVDKVYSKVKKQMETEALALMANIDDNLSKLDSLGIFPLECDCCNQLKFFKVTDEEKHEAKSIDCNDVTITTEELSLVNATYTLFDWLYVDYAVHTIDSDSRLVYARDEDKFDSLIKERMKNL